MATYYWVGGAGTWNTSTTTNWASSSNGAGGAGVPTSADDVIIDSSSGTGIITCTGAVCNNLTVTATQAITLGTTSSTLSVFGDMSLPSGNSFGVSGNLSITFSATTTGKTITTNGKTLGLTTIFNGVGGGWTLGSALTVPGASSTITFTNGTFDTSSVNNYALTAGSLALGSGTKTVNLNASTVTLAGSSPITFTTNTAGFTFNAGTSQINCSALNPTLNGGSQTFYNVTFTSNNSYTITGANIFNDLTLTTSASALRPFTISDNQTINGTFTCSGSASVQRAFVRSDTIGTTRTITANAISANDCDFRDITLAGTAAGASPTRAGDCGGNSGITFPAAKTVYWNLSGTQSWNSTAWATTPNGTPNSANFPLVQDTAVFTDSGVAGTAQFVGYNIGTIDASGRTSAMTLTHSSSATLYGSYTLGSGVTVSGTSAQTFSGRGTQTFTSAGKTVTFPITVDKPAGAFELGDAITSSSSITLTRGTFNGNTFNVTCTTFSSSNSNTRTLTLGNGLLTLTGAGTVWNTNIITGLTFNIGTSDILLSDTSTTARTFSGGGLSFNKLTIGGTTGTSNTSISNFAAVPGVFGELASIKTVAHTILFQNNISITTWSVKGTAGNVVTVNSSVTGTSRLIPVTNKTIDIDYLSIRDIFLSLDSSNTYIFYAGTNSTNVLNNQNIAFIDRSTNNRQVAQLLGSANTTWTTPNDWNNSNNKIYLMAGGGGGANNNSSGDSRAAGGGGGGGGFGIITNFNSSPGAVVSCSIASATPTANVDGANTTWASTYTAIGGKRGNAAGVAQSSTGGAGGGYSPTSNPEFVGFTGGTGGAGAFGTAASTGYGGGGGGGAAGLFGNGGNGGDGFGSSTSASIAGGGGGGNGGGSNGGNASAGVGGTGGNGWLGTGGGAPGAGTRNTGGGAAGFINASITGPGNGIEIFNTIGGAGGWGGRSNQVVGFSAPASYTYGFGGGGAGMNTTGGSGAGIPGGAGFIFIVYTEASISNVSFGFRLANTGILYVPTTSQFDEVTQSTISVKPTAFYAEEFDEVTNPGVPARYLNNGIVQTQSIIDEITGIS